MVNDKKLGQYCSFLHKYVPVLIKYFPNHAAIKSCDNCSCGNTDCDLCDTFVGDKAQGQDCLK